MWEARDGARERREELRVEIGERRSKEAERRAPELHEVVVTRGHLASVEAREARSQLLHLRERMHMHMRLCAHTVMQMLQ